MTILLFLVLLNCPPLAATPADESEADDATPSLELLEFLAEWETQEGEWVDPARLGLTPDEQTPEPSFPPESEAPHGDP